jgi:hypothetical protein
MDETIFEHTIFSSIDDYLEHCRKRLQGDASTLLYKLDPELTGLVVMLAFDTAKSSKRALVATPSQGWPTNVLDPLDSRIQRLLDFMRLIDHKMPIGKSGTVFYPTRTVGQSILKEIQQNVLKEDILTFYSKPLLAGSFVIFASLWFMKAEYEQYYSFAPSERQVRSLVDAATTIFLQDGYNLMLDTLTQDGFEGGFSISFEHILKRAGAQLLRRISFYLPKDFRNQEEIDIARRSVTLFEDLNAVAKSYYERTPAFGHFLICPPNHPNVKILVNFTTPAWSSNHRQIRKLLEIARDDFYLLCYNGDIYALGRRDGDYDPMLENLFEIEIVEHATWRLKHGEDVLMDVAYGQPSLHIEAKANYLRLLEEALGTEFDELSPEKIQHLCSLTKMAMEQQHGTMLLISTHAEVEAGRLEKQSIHIEPVSITEELMTMITAIDGAVLLDVDGRCYAIGVILDGTVKPGEGDPSRGARYHAALKYLN